VESDLADFGEKLKNAFNPADAQELGEVLPAVCEALSHYRGPFAHGSDYLWVEGLREHFTTQATDAAIRLARATERAGAEPAERDSVLGVLERLCTLHPDRERLAQHAIRLYQAAGRHDAAHNTFERLQRTLHDLGLAPDQATRALIAPRVKTATVR
jgi:DNA-binding SARP family transcriptional activator